MNDQVSNPDVLKNTHPAPMEKIQQAHDFMDSLELHEPVVPLQVANFVTSTAASKEIESDSKGAYVNNGSLVTFVDGISAQHKKDVLNSTLLAQLAATKKYDRYKDTEAWYKFYIDTLEKIGWVAQSFSFSEYQVSGSTFTVDKVVLDVLKAIASENEMAVVQETLKALEALSDKDGKLVLFDSNSHHQGNGNFQIASARETDGDVAVNLGAFYFDSTQNSTKVLFFEFKSSDTKIFKGTESAVLNEEVYSQVRDKIVTKLGGKIAQNVDEIEI